MKLKNLSILTGILFVISIFVFINENKRGTDLLAGSDYIKGLDVSKIQKIVLNFKEKDKLVLSRDGERFVLESHKSYPAASDKVNDLVYKIASIQVDKKIASSVREEDLKKYELDEKSRQFSVELFDNDNKKTVSFRVGKSDKDKSYLFKEGEGDVYLSRNKVWFNSSYKYFVNTVLLNVKSDDVVKIHLKSNAEIEIVKKEKDFIVTQPPGKQFKKEKALEYAQSFTVVRFDDFYSVNEPEVQGLRFTKEIKLQLENKLIYEMSFAKKKKEYFVKLQARVEEAPRQIVLKKSDGAEKLKDVENVIESQATARIFNLEKGRWVYKISESLYEKLLKNSKFFL